MLTFRLILSSLSLCFHLWTNIRKDFLVQNIDCKRYQSRRTYTNKLEGRNKKLYVHRKFWASQHLVEEFDCYKIALFQHRNTIETSFCRFVIIKWKLRFFTGFCVCVCVNDMISCEHTEWNNWMCSDSFIRTRQNVVTERLLH